MTYQVTYRQIWTRRIRIWGLTWLKIGFREENIDFIELLKVLKIKKITLSGSEPVYMTCPVGYTYIYIVFHQESESEVRIDEFFDPEEKTQENRIYRTIYNYIVSELVYMTYQVAYIQIWTCRIRIWRPRWLKTSSR